MLTPAGFPPTSPALGGGLGPLGGPANLGAAPAMGGNLFGGPQDGAQFSPDAGAAPGGLDLSALMDNLQQMDPKQLRIMQLNQEIQATQGQLQQAQAQGDQGQVQQLEQKLQQLQQELQQLMGGEQAGAGGGEAGGVPGGGGGDAGGIPSGGGGGGGAPSGGGDVGGGGGPSGGGGVNNGGGGHNGGGGGPSGVGGPSGGNSSGGADGPGSASAIPNPQLAGDDKALAASIEKQLEGTPLAGKGLGDHFVAAGRQQNVDPLALVAISKHETNHGKLGVGIKKHMGVGAYDNNPNGKTPYDGAVQQIYSGAKTFANLRRKGGSNADAPMSQQLAAVNRAGWATDKNWHNGVGRAYNTVVAKANQSGGNTAVASNNTSKPSTPAPTKTASAPSSSSTKKA